MLLKTYQFEAIFTPILNTDDFELEITFDKYPLKIKGLSKKLLIEKQSSLSGEHAIYILEGPSSCYVGQSKDVQSRIKNHTGKNKADFHRCFVLSSSNKDTDWRVYLDYMESYAIKEMECLGYSLENTKKPNPEDDILKKTKKETASEWINIFLSFLPILGFRKSPQKTIQEEPIFIEETNEFEVDYKNKKVTHLLIDLIVYIGIEKTINNYPEIFKSNIFITTENKCPKSYIKLKSPNRIVEENNKKYYFWVHSSDDTLKKKIKKISDKMNISIIEK